MSFLRRPWSQTPHRADWQIRNERLIARLRRRGVRIGDRCVIGAGAVVRGEIPDNSVAMGNPAAVVGRTGLFLEMMNASGNTLDTSSLPAGERERRIREHFQRS